MYDNNQYTLRTETVRGATRYFVSFVDGQDIEQETEVSPAVYLEFLRFVRIERNLRRWTERHVEFSELSEETLYMRALQPPKSLEDLAMDNLHDERLQDAIANLSETQRRRFVLYYEFGLTYEDIAEIDGCKWQSVQNSVGRARKKVIEN